MKKLLLSFALLCSLSSIAGNLFDGLKFSGMQTLSSLSSKVYNNNSKNLGVKLTDDSLLNELINSDNLVFIKFYAHWCGPCNNWAPIVNDVARANPEVEKDGKKVNVIYVEINIDQYKSISNRYSVASIPTSIIFHKGSQKNRSVGACDKNSLINRLKNSIA